MSEKMAGKGKKVRKINVYSKHASFESYTQVILEGWGALTHFKTCVPQVK